MSETDLDDLLDEALDDLDEKLEKNDKKSKKKEEELNDAVQKANAAPDSFQIQKMMEMLMSSSAPEDLNFEELTSNLNGLIDVLESSGAAEEDRETLGKLKSVLTSLKEEDFDGATEILNQIPSENSAEGTAAEEYAKKLQEGSGDIESELAQTLLTTCTSPEMQKMMELMRDAFPAWIAAHPELSPQELERHQKQYEKSCTFCDLLKENGDNQKVAEIFEILSEFSELGELPQGLADFAPAESDDTASE